MSRNRHRTQTRKNARKAFSKADRKETPKEALKEASEEIPKEALPKRQDTFPHGQQERPGADPQDTASGTLPGGRQEPPGSSGGKAAPGKEEGTVFSKTEAAFPVIPETPLAEQSGIPKYDAGYKQEFSNKSHFLHFLKKYVKADWAKELTEENIELCDREFLLDGFLKRQADLLYQVTRGEMSLYVYVLMELQSTVDFTMPLRFFALIFGLLLRIFLDTPEKERARKDFRLPVVLPILFYNGEMPWSAQTQFRQYLNHYELFGRHALNFEYYLVDLYRLEDDYILNSNTIIDNILALDKNRKSSSLPDILTCVAQRFRQLPGSAASDFRRWLEYVLLSATDAANRENVKELMDRLKGDDPKMIHGLQQIIIDEYAAGREAARKESIRKAVLILRELEITDRVILQKLQEAFQLTPEEAQSFVGETPAK
ncbi:MAG: Rpn family recombination-promoting nuclease/putative transposase [Clostridium sp.]|jgi:hypothetical protein|nr:Rpn family recombination-promoting nuclease/putative transposase [Clostridium sp.]